MIQSLLTQIAATDREYKKIAAITGENFNIFRILKVESSEVYTHSAFICELLNPNGSHGCKDIFLKLFIEQQKHRQNDQSIFDLLVNFDSPSAVVSIESHIGFKNDDETEGGRIDILIKDKNNNAVIIENKVYAKDQNKQLVRYKNAFTKAPIFYLTLDGHHPCEDSKGILKDRVDYVCISYKDDVILWLEKCRKEATTHSILRESITQYINLIKYLTGQTINENMKNEMIDLILKSNENIESAQKISEVWKQVELEILRQLGEKIKTIAEDLELFVDIDDLLGDKYSCFAFYKEGWKHCIYFEFQKKFDELFVGIVNRDDNDKCDVERFKKGLSNFVIERKTSSSWIWGENFTPWGTTTWGDVLTKTPIDIKDWCERILTKLREVELVE